MTKEQLASNINNRVQAINPMTPGTNVGEMVSTIIADEVDAYCNDMTITITVPALTVTNGTTNEVELTATIEAL